VFVGGCPSSLFSMAPAPSPLAVDGHSGRMFRSSKGRSGGGPSGGRHVVCNVLCVATAASSVGL
jgi:hypothetical protein